MLFRNRRQAGHVLAEKLQFLASERPIVIALPSGGVPVAQEVAQDLHAPMDTLVVRKIGAPDDPEYGIGAVTEEGCYWLNGDAVESVGATQAQLQQELESEYEEVLSRVGSYRRNRPLPSLAGRTVIVVDDGIATGVTAWVAGKYLREKGPRKLVLATPVAASRTASALREQEFDEVITLNEPDGFFSVGQFYENFDQITDDEVVDMVDEAKAQFPFEEKMLKCDTDVLVTDLEEEIELPGHLFVPESAKGVVLFAHGSGSSRFSPRNQQVARALNDAGFGTLLFDLLTEDESEYRSNVFDIPLLADRLALATRWLQKQDGLGALPLGYFGASTGGAAALWAAADLGDQISAVVSRGGRPDLAIPRLPDVVAPTLLIVGGEDVDVIEMNSEAMKHLQGGKLVLVPGATHLFEEPGALEQVARHAVAWFDRCFGERERKKAA